MRGDKIPHTRHDTPNRRTIPPSRHDSIHANDPMRGDKIPHTRRDTPNHRTMSRHATIQYTPTIPGAGTKYPTQGVTRPITAQCPVTPRFNTRQRSQARGQNAPPMKFSPLCPANHPFFRLSSHVMTHVSSRQKADKKPKIRRERRSLKNTDEV